MEYKIKMNLFYDYLDIEQRYSFIVTLNNEFQQIVTQHLQKYIRYLYLNVL